MREHVWWVGEEAAGCCGVLNVVKGLYVCVFCIFEGVLCSGVDVWPYLCCVRVRVL